MLAVPGECREEWLAQQCAEGAGCTRLGEDHEHAEGLHGRPGQLGAHGPVAPKKEVAEHGGERGGGHGQPDRFITGFASEKL